MPRNLDELLLLYDLLPPDQQREVERYVQGDPEREQLLEEVRAVYATLARARDLEKTLSDDLLAYYVATRATSGPLPPALREAFDRIEARVEAQPALQERLSVLRAEMAQLEAEAEDPLAQFERLSGRRLEDEPPPKPRRTADRPAARQPAQHRLRRVGRWAGRLAVAASVLVLLLVGLSRMATSETERLAFVAPDAVDTLAGLRLRGAETVLKGTDLRYIEAVQQLGQARSTTFGLFPRYDERLIADAASQLKDVVAATAPTSFVHLDARFYLGKAYLALGRIDEARDELQVVVEEGGAHASQAQRILRELDETA